MRKERKMEHAFQNQVSCVPGEEFLIYLITAIRAAAGVMIIITALWSDEKGM